MMVVKVDILASRPFVAFANNHSSLDVGKLNNSPLQDGFAMVLMEKKRIIMSCIFINQIRF